MTGAVNRVQRDSISRGRMRIAASPRFREQADDGEGHAGGDQHEMPVEDDVVDVDVVFARQPSGEAARQAVGLHDSADGAVGEDRRRRGRPTGWQAAVAEQRRRGRDQPAAGDEQSPKQTPPTPGMDGPDAPAPRAR